MPASTRRGLENKDSPVTFLGDFEMTSEVTFLSEIQKRT